MSDAYSSEPVSTTHQAHTLRSNEVTVLREIVKIYELEAANNEIVAAQFRQITDSRFYPLAVLTLKVANVIERWVRRVLHRAPMASQFAGPPAPPAPEPAPPQPVDPRLMLVGLEDEPDEAALPVIGSEEEEEVSAKPQNPRVVKFKRGLFILKHSLKVAVVGNGKGRTSPRLEANPYFAWTLAYRLENEHVRNHLKRRIALINPQPLMSVVMASYNPDHRFFREAIDSVLDQYYENFELLIADDCSPDAEVRSIVEEYAAQDQRVRLVRRDANGGISAATNSAISVASGEWLVFMDHDDTLVPHALLHVVLAAQEHPQATLIYSDEDKINEANEPFTPYFKSDFDPLLLLGQNYVSHLTCIRRDIVNDLGGLRSEFDGSQDWDLVLRVTESVSRSTIIHIPHVLYHWRSHAGSTSLATEAKPWAVDAGRRAVTDALARRGIHGEVKRVPGSGFNRVVFALPENPPKVSVLIPTRDGKYLGDCLQSLLDKTTYPNFEVVVIDNGSVKPFTQAMFHVLSDKIKVVRDDSPFNYSALHNRAVPSCEGEILLLLNDDTEIIDGEWMSHMIAQLLQPGVGAVGAKLLYPDGRIQHAGVLLGPQGLASHVGQFRPAADMGYFGRTALASEYQAVTAACLAVHRHVWESVGGLDENLKVAFNDIDFCLRVQAAGHKVTYTPLAQLLHYESVSRGSDQHGEKYIRFINEVLTVRDRWGLEIARDPYYNPNLSLNHGLFQLAYPPRTSPWYTGIE
ncbi:MAG: glycosyltransferase [Actinomycetota bacterium]|jgi:glycosyltransferase involved in cell wall biosynthesis|nr:glycosyltransferase [Actinomycetota bacterium]